MLTTDATEEFVLVADIATETGRTERTVWRWLANSNVPRYRDVRAERLSGGRTFS